MIIIVFTGCADGSDANPIEAVQDHYAALEEFSVKADVTADFGERTDSYILAYDYKDNAGRVTVLSPESIAGIALSTMDSGLTLEYDGIVLDAGKPEGLELSPAGALAFIHKVWRENTARDSAGEKMREIDCVRLTYQAHIGADKVEVTSWFNKDGYAPVRSEISYEGRMVIACDYEG